MWNNLGADVSVRTDIDKSSDGYGSLINTANGWKPIGDSTNPFIGTLNGHGNEIADLYIDRPSTPEVGLFGNINSAVVQQLTLSNATVTGDWKVGALAGRVAAGEITSVDLTSGTISGSTVSVPPVRIGGLAGDASTVTVNTSSANATVDGQSSLGGLIGDTQSNPVDISNSYTAGNITGSGSSIGGLVGLHQDGMINNSYAVGNVTGGSSVGGLVGESGTAAPTFTNNSYATGKVTGSSSVGGLLGTLSAGALDESYYDNSSTGTTQGQAVGTVSGGTVGPDVEGLFTNQAQGSAAPGNITAFDFSATGTWATITSPDDYPVLRAIPEQEQLDARD